MIESLPRIRRLLIMLLLAAISLTSVAPIHAAASASPIADIPATVGWHELPNTRLRSVCPPNNYGGANYLFHAFCPAVTAAWSSGVMDSLRNRLIVWGGGHNDYYGNEVYALNLNSQTVERLTNPSVPTNQGGACNVTTLPDGNPNGRHTYDGLSYMPNVDRMFVIGGAPSCGPGGLTNDTWTFKLADNTWQKMNPAGPLPTPVPGIVTAYDPNTGKVFLHDNWNLFSYTYASNTYQKLGADSAIDYHLSAVIDPVRKKFVMIGGGQAWLYDIANGSAYVRQPLTAPGAAAIVNSVYPGLAYDPVSDRIVAWNGGDTVYSLNLDTNTWTSLTFPNGPGAAIDTGTYKRWSYSAAHGVFVVINRMDDNAYVLRLNSAAAGPPGAPTGVSAVAGNGRATVRFTAPADGGGSAITEYTVSVNPPGGIDKQAGSTSLNHTVTGLTNGVAYTFTVRATNANGIGPASASSNAVTPAMGKGSPIEWMQLLMD